MKYTHEEIVKAIAHIKSKITINREMSLTDVNESGRQWHLSQISLLEQRLKELEEMLLKWK